MDKTISVSAQIPAELGKILNQVSTIEERTKSYYIKKGLEKILRDRIENIKEYQEAKQAYDEFIVSGDQPIPFEEIKKDLNL